jgi:hypothetical protein
MIARTSIAALVSVALTLPAAAVAKTIPVKHGVKPTTARWVHCVCSAVRVAQPLPSAPVVQPGWEAQWDQDLIDLGFAPVYGTHGTDGL